MSIANLFKDNNYDIYANSVHTNELFINTLDANNIITNNIDINDELKLKGDTGDNRQVIFSDGSQPVWDNIKADDIQHGPNDYYLYSNGVTSKWINRNVKFCMYTPQGADPNSTIISLEPGAQDIANGPTPPAIWNPVEFQNNLITNPTIITKDPSNTLFYPQIGGYYKITLTAPVIENTSTILFTIFKNGVLNFSNNYGAAASSPIDTTLFSIGTNPILQRYFSTTSLTRIILFNFGDFFGIYSNMQAADLVSSQKNYFVGNGSASLIIEFLGGNLIIN